MTASLLRKTTNDGDNSIRCTLPQWRKPFALEGMTRRQQRHGQQQKQQPQQKSRNNLFATAPPSTSLWLAAHALSKMIIFLFALCLRLRLKNA
jgi:hypothetical protein